MKYQIEQIPADIAEQLCRDITTDLPEWFGFVNHHPNGTFS